MFAEANWFSVLDGDPRAVDIFLRHYSSKKGRRDRKVLREHGFTGPGASIVLMSPNCDALFAWRAERARRDGQTGVNCTVFRNEGPMRSSDLIREACDLAWAIWPGERLYTFVNPKEIASENPGFCFKEAGWSLVRDPNGKAKRTTRGLIILEIFPEPPFG